jgi:hypothetical protein|tara:strand:- start:10230 stop:10985 length:756 start_codon:yes stop_codon:yes gene_type:complete
MATIGDVITASLQDLGLIAASESPTADDSALALSRANDWIDGLATQGLTVYTDNTRTTWTIVSGTTSYTVGTTGTVACSRPTSPDRIVNIGYQDTSVSPTQEYLLGRPLTNDAYASLTPKSLTATYPQYWYYEPTFTSSLGTLSPWPVPTGSGLEGVIYTPTPVTEFSALTDTILLPPGYRRFYRTSLAMELAPSFSVEPSPSLQRLANDAEVDVKRSNSRTSDLSLGDVAWISGNAGTSLGRARFDTGNF